MSRPRLLDLFCGGGGAAAGYHAAGFEVVGVDLVDRQGRFPHMDFVKGDALEFLEQNGAEFDVIHASPPCQPFTRAGNLAAAQGKRSSKRDLVDPTRDALVASSKPWVIENVPGAPVSGVVLCGSSFGLKVRRHRIFESPLYLFGRGNCDHAAQGRPIGVYHSRADDIPGGGRTARTADEGREAMGIDWPLPWASLVEAIPPAYTEWIGRQLL